VSFTDPAEPVQPEIEGQGDEASGGSPWESYLTRFPEEARDTAAEAFREMEANANKKFEGHAEFRKQWEPLSETGVNQLPAQDVSWLVQFRQALDNPEVMQQWWEGYARENGLTVAEAKAEAAPTEDEFGFQDPQQLVEKLLEERLGPVSKQLEQFSSMFEAQGQQQREQEASHYIDGQVTALEKEHNSGNRFDEETREILNTLAGKYIESDPMNAIPRGWQDYQKLINTIEKSTLNGKVNQLAPAEAGGIPSVTPESHKRIDSDGVKDAALEFLRNNNRA
jgi:hypothetical protein